ncbi:MAG: hypothetical protein R2745_01060 [Vicinamibacterales bacterium]
MRARNMRARGTRAGAAAPIAGVLGLTAIDIDATVSAVNVRHVSLDSGNGASNRCRLADGRNPLAFRNPGRGVF